MTERVAIASLRGQLIRIGDRVKVKHQPGKRNGYHAIVMAITVNDKEIPTEFSLFGGPRNHESFRAVVAERVSLAPRRT